MTSSSISLGELYVKRSSVDPSKHSDELFDLFSVPAYEKREPEILVGSDIGSSKVSVEPGDTLLCRIVPHIRRAWVVPSGGQSRQIASGEWIILRHPEVDPNYLRQLLLSNTFHSKFMSTVAGVGGSLMRARPAHAAMISIPLPPLPEQRRIADILDSADDLRDQRRNALSYLDNLSESVFVEMFGNVAINSLNFEERRFAEIGSLDRGVSRARPRNAPDLLGGMHPLIQTGDVASSGGYIRAYSQSYSDKGLAQSKMWPAGTLAITIAANIAKTGILTFPACFPDSVVGFIPDRNLANVEYVRYWLRSLQSILERQAPSSAQKNINLQILRALRVPVPSLKTQNLFAEHLAGISALRSAHQDSAARLDELFASLQHRAFSGTL